MHAVPTAAVDATAPKARPPLWARLNHPAAAGIIATIAVTAEVVARVLVRLRGNVSGLALVGNVFAYPWELPGGLEVDRKSVV